MQQPTDRGPQRVDELAQRYSVGTDAVMTLLQALVNNNGNMAQFNHWELGGGGQWMRGGMTMVGNMFMRNIVIAIFCDASGTSIWPTHSPSFGRPGGRNGMHSDGRIPRKSFLSRPRRISKRSFSSGSRASTESLKQITDAPIKQSQPLVRSRSSIGSGHSIRRQINSRICIFSLKHGVPTRLVFVCFVGDSEMEARECRPMLQVARRILGLPKRNRFSDRLIDVFPEISALAVESRD